MYINDGPPRIYVTIDMPDGVICKGAGNTIEEAFQDAKKQLEIARTPKHGPWMWEQNKSYDRKS